MNLKPHGEWEPIPRPPTALSQTLRPPVPTWTDWVRVPPRHEAAALLHSKLSWKELPSALHVVRGSASLSATASRRVQEYAESAMRTVLICTLLWASVSLAQNVPGAWGGYVTGWTSDSPRYDTRLPRDFDLRRPVLTREQRNYLALQQLAAQQAFFAQQNYVQLSAAQARQQELAAQQLVQQQELIAEQRRAAKEQELAAQQQLLAQQQAIAVQQQILAQAQQQAAAEERARVAEREEKLEQTQAQLKEQAEQEAARLALARAEADAKPKVKGPDIHRWVDGDGVVHYSTKPRN